MKRSVVLLLIVAGWTVAALSPAFGLPFSGTTIGTWVNVVSNEPDDVYWVMNDDAGATADFVWGMPADNGFSSQFRFDGTGSDGGPGWIAEENMPFSVGQFRYFNESTYNSAGIAGVDLNLELAMTSPVITDEVFGFTFTIENTPNETGDPILDGDIVRIVNAFSTNTFAHQGIEYTLMLLGFSTDGGATFTDDFSSPEGGDAIAAIYATITSDTAPVPEPGTFTVLFLGFLLLVYRGMRGC